MRKKYSTLTIALLIATTTYLAAQDWVGATTPALRTNSADYTYSPELQKITDDYLKANGGIQAYRKTISMYVEGTYQANNSNYNIKIIKANPNRQASFISNDKFRQLTLFDGKRITISNNLSEPPELDDEQAREFYRNAPIFDILYRKIVEHAAITLEHNATIDGIECTVLSVFLEKNLTAYYYLDSDYLTIRKETIRTKDDGSTSTTTTDFSDYKRINDIPVAMRQTTTTDSQPEGKFHAEDIQFNIPVAAAMFTPEYWFESKDTEQAIPEN